METKSKNMRNACHVQSYAQWRDVEIKIACGTTIDKKNKTKIKAK